ncbi:Polysaccharide pyruvyl transferase family protein WcaK [Amphibacillus marinus]|uniref:Polysaccharide pyruvyl transferase family protein WcaK n=1 Tax=Amphibacillus marinus TaxID=872970 RepID=A0A1H8N5B1_9BACI|nr:polysaccharide pyruvyl transferase family protein [Amphibacillus marinus]SEO24706.1 Polysaccharide pyruvyl transferase family protein WcaK [Amphibacillus marinus]
MKNILVRAGMSPLDPFNADEILMNNSIGGNVGNLVYQYSVFRTLMAQGVNVEADYYSQDAAKAEEYNEKYDCYIIPLADAFREPFIPALKRYTNLIKKLTIPVIVVGVGLRAPFEPKLNEGFPFDEAVKDFVNAVLEKSSIIGVRGQITADYLTRLGFREGIDHTVIGCPSMYTFGRELKIRDTNITKDSKISINSSRMSPSHVLDFITRAQEEIPDYTFIPQWLKEMELVYTGARGIAKPSDNYPVQMSDRAYMEDRVRFFLNVPTWIEFLQSVDLSFGARLHGNITSTIAGTPSILIAKDARMRELAEYHQLTHITKDDITAETKLFDVINEVDFKSPEKIQGKNFDHFIDFLEKNGLNHIYKNQSAQTSFSVPLEEKLKSIRLQAPLKTIAGCTLDEMVARWESYYPLVDKRNVNTKENLEKISKEQKDKIRKQEGTIKKQKGTLNRKSVKLALRTANLFSTTKK